MFVVDVVVSERKQNTAGNSGILYRTKKSFRTKKLRSNINVVATDDDEIDNAKFQSSTAVQ